jgi:biofilm protein TabA
MILDVIDRLADYCRLHAGFGAARHFLARADLGNLPDGRYEIDGTAVYALVMRAPGKTSDAASLEVHNAYIDIQAVLEGTDTMGWKSRAACKRPQSDYDPGKDLQFFGDRPDAWFAVGAGQFAIFFPEDAHAPMVSDGPIHKVVVKVAVTV